MDTMLFTSDSLWTMVHGIALGGGALLALFAALVALRTPTTAAEAAPAADPQARSVAWLLVAAAVILWVTVIIGTYVIFPPYRATPPDGLVDLSQYPRALIRANPGTAWLHSYAMETKEHVPWIAAMLGTAAAYIGLRYQATVLRDNPVRTVVTALVAICFLLVAYAAILGVFVNKVAPLD